MTPPPPNQPPNDPPSGGPTGAFGPPPEGFGPPPEGYGPPPPQDTPPPGTPPLGRGDQGGQSSHGHPGWPSQPGGPVDPPPPDLGGYGGQQAGFGDPGFGPPGSPGQGRGRVVAVVAGAVVVVGLAAVAVVALTKSGGGGSKHDAGKSPSPSVTRSVSSPAPKPSLSLPPLPSVSIPAAGIDPNHLLPSDLYSYLPTGSPEENTIPYVELKTGQCFNTPGLDTSVDVIKTTSCHKAHDAEVIGHATLKGSFSTEKELADKAGKLCRPMANKAANRQADGRIYYNYVVHPVLTSYRTGIDTVSCSLTLSDKPGGKKLTGPLK